MTRLKSLVLAIALAFLSAIFSLKQIHSTVRTDGDIDVGATNTIDSVVVAGMNAATDDAKPAPLPYPSEEQRRKCQIIYILGVEGTMHHGVEPIIEKLARHQFDETGTPYSVSSSSNDLRYGLFGYPVGQFNFIEAPPINDISLVNDVMTSICPNDNLVHVTIESTSFPSGGKHHSTSRIHRQSSWLQMTPSSIANSFTALNHPTNLYTFYEAYSLYADVKFVVLHRNFLDVIASHKNFDDGPLQHANVILGYLILIGRFLQYIGNKVGNGNSRVWTLLDTDLILTKRYNTQDEVTIARRGMVHDLVNFLGWNQRECGDCFDDWVDSTNDAVTLLGHPNVKKLNKLMADEMDGVWPPSVNFRR